MPSGRAAAASDSGVCAFSVPGISRYYVASVLARDYTVVLGITVLVALMIIVANLIVDILQAYLDPRIRTVTA